MAAPVHPYSDYGVALRTLRNGRNWLGLLLFACVLTQLVGFALVRYSARPYKHYTPGIEKSAPIDFDVLQHAFQRWMAGNSPSSASTPSTAPSATQPAVTSDENAEDQFTFESMETRKLNFRSVWSTTLKIAIPMTQLLGLVAAASQTLVIFITLLLILVAQAPGVAHVTKSLNWAVLLLFMVFPWQHIAHEFPIPGVFYSFDELLRSMIPYVVRDAEPPAAFARTVFYARFVLWPIATMLLMLITAERFRAGLRLAIGHPLQGLMQSRMPTPNLAATPAARSPLAEKRLV